MSLSNIPTVVAACCILHNICEVHGERFNDQWLESLSELPQPPTASHRDGIDAPKEIRNTLVHHFLKINAMMSNYFHYCLHEINTVQRQSYLMR